MLSPIEIKTQEFSRSMRGYDIAEVRSFLETASEDFQKLNESVRSLQTQVDQLKVELDTFRRMDMNMKEALVNAQETLRETREGSRREADLLRREAELEAEHILKAGRQTSEMISNEIKTLTDRRDRFVRKLRNILRSELELIELLESDDMSPDSSIVADEQE